MKKYSSLLLLLILSLLVMGCSEKKNYEISAKYKFLKIENAKSVEIDFSKSKVDLIKYLESEAEMDFCEDRSINTYFTFKEDKVVFPIEVFKYCGVNFSHKNYISININSDNELLINHYPLKSRNARMDILLKAKTKNKVEKFEINDLLYVVQWDNKIDKTEIKNRFLELLNFIKEYSDELSMEQFNKTSNDLNQEELLVLREKYNPVIAIEQSIIPLIPFHPDSIE